MQQRGNIIYELEKHESMRSVSTFYLFKDKFILGIYGTKSDAIRGIIRDFHGKEYEIYSCCIDVIDGELYYNSKICGISIEESIREHLEDG